MKVVFFILLLQVFLFARPSVAVTYPFIGELVDEIGGEYVDITVLAKGNWDPHFVVPRPSLIAKLRRSDALIMNGAQLEIGWLPPLIKRASNRAVMPGASTFLNLSHQVELIQKPKSVDRAQGDVHPEGNPHFHLDPRKIPVLARSISEFLIRLDSAHQDAYRNNLLAFSTQWESNLTKWAERMAGRRGMKVIQFHDNLAYFNQAYGLQSIGTIEPLPGIPPSPRHTLKIISLIHEKEPCCILHDVYHSTKTAEYIQEKTGIKLILMPHDIDAVASVKSLKDLFDYLTEAVNHD